MWGVSGSPEYQQRSTDGPVGVGANQKTTTDVQIGVSKRGQAFTTFKYSLSQQCYLMHIRPDSEGIDCSSKLNCVFVGICPTICQGRAASVPPSTGVLYVSCALSQPACGSHHDMYCTW